PLQPGIMANQNRFGAHRFFLLVPGFFAVPDAKRYIPLSQFYLPPASSPSGSCHLESSLPAISALASPPPACPGPAVLFPASSRILSPPLSKKLTSTACAS